MPECPNDQFFLERDLAATPAHRELAQRSLGQHVLEQALSRLGGICLLAAAGSTGNCIPWVKLVRVGLWNRLRGGYLLVRDHAMRRGVREPSSPDRSPAGCNPMSGRPGHPRAARVRERLGGGVRETGKPWGLVLASEAAGGRCR